MSPVDPTRSTLTSAASMRVLAHPTRLRLLGLLRERGPQTAAQLGDVVDEAPGTVSYHLAKLASIELIEAAEPQSSDKRERWWKATTALTSWDTAQLLDDPEKAAASSVLQKSIGQAYAARYSDYVDSLPSLPREWVKAGASSDRTLRLTVDELAAMNAELEALIARWEMASATHDASGDAVGGGGAGNDATSSEATGSGASGAAASGVESVVVVYQAYRRP
ncbi:helix-turn-helix domain-containing protein [Agreia sp. COWG]|uniref:winged helix-turn-helix domain-containing protein n=1 Tax=Agreia sp. COWG TaxID=2773266 RepID=UPI0019294389|nr:helix-turn-helix domain-containing protein [Agreia sp. COWG]CAD6008624.1 HTH arsR-type domain-containing protein [Agreia sp. COWG]